MAPLKSRLTRLFLLLALMLPLQSFAWLECGPPDELSHAAHQHCQDSAGGLAQHHHCGNCCVAAIVSAPLRFTAPAFTHPSLSLPAHRPWVKVALERLDRPPRFFFR